MEPALRSGDRVLVRRTRRVRRGAVTLLRAPGGDPMLLKRVVAGPGDRLRPGWAEVDVQAIGGAVVPAGCAVVLGDNRDVSWDSRHYGFVARDQVIGVVIRQLNAGT